MKNAEIILTHSRLVQAFMHATQAYTKHCNPDDPEEKRYYAERERARAEITIHLMAVMLDAFPIEDAP